MILIILLDRVIDDNFSIMFRNTGAPSGISYTKAYHNSSLRNTLAKTLGLNKYRQYINLDNTLVPGQLVSDSDFTLLPMQTATYFYINTCPMWKSIKNGNWRRIEDMIRQLTVSYFNLLKSEFTNLYFTFNRFFAKWNSLFIQEPTAY